MILLSKTIAFFYLGQHHQKDHEWPLLYKPLHWKGKRNSSFLHIFLPTPQVAITAAIMQHTLLSYTKKYTRSIYKKKKKKLYSSNYMLGIIH